ncbi:MAG: UDP-N-acetylmuramate dehydrogenase, partial [Thiotrichaceae bacterium]|nr:UDP-N-acetylmuramate dehydrogenase [Thiotrichaceae bacterium]
FLSGIPGTIGGALVMNAGAFGSEIWNYVKQVTMIDRQGKLSIRTAHDFTITYRKVVLKNDALSPSNREWFVQGEFLFNKDEDRLNKSKQEIKHLLAKRAATQPTKQANAGSVFKNPKNDYAARLIESCGLKGFAINDAQVSEKHANFIINKGKARACDVEALIEKIQQTVFARCQVKLETEVRIMGLAEH